MFLLGFIIILKSTLQKEIVSFFYYCSLIKMNHLQLTCMKQAMARQNELTLVSIPCWWDGKSSWYCLISFLLFDYYYFLLILFFAG